MNHKKIHTQFSNMNYGNLNKRITADLLVLKFQMPGGRYGKIWNQIGDLF